MKSRTILYSDGQLIQFWQKATAGPLTIEVDSVDQLLFLKFGLRRVRAQILAKMPHLAAQIRPLQATPGGADGKHSIIILPKKEVRRHEIASGLRRPTRKEIALQKILDLE